MLLYLTDYLSEFVRAFSVFQYLTLRSMISAMTALFLSLVIGPMFIDRLSRKQIAQKVRSDGPLSHLSKEGTPTMGGSLIIVVITISTLCWGDLSNKYIWLVLLVTAAFGLVGWLDDYLKIRRGNTRGLVAKWKIFWQTLIAMAASFYLYMTAESAVQTDLIVPFFKEVAIPLGLGFILLSSLMLVGMSNAVNLTDGLDGLAILPTVMVAGGLGLIAYLVGNIEYSSYLQIPYVVGSGELSVFCGALIGAGLGFLWFNTYPAQVFMGDVGSLALGAALAIVAIIVRHEIILLIMGGLFVVETASVIVQVISYRLTGKRVFRMAPIHHHFELKGWAEPKVIVRFWIITLVLVTIGISSLKLR